MTKEKLKIEWYLKDTIFKKDQGKVFSCFSCCGGSTMGYKLSGFDVIGCNEIDPRLMRIYKENHNPDFSYCESIRDFNKRDKLPNELFNLDILDGSPPCSSFSIAGNREKDWGKEKKYREGQQKQVLDTLFFDFIETTNKLKPKTVIAENVKGIIQGKAKKYTKKIVEEFNKIGYHCEYYLLKAKNMNVPQKRERVFFICVRKDLLNDAYFDFTNNKLIIDLNFSEKEILFSEIKDYKGKPLTEYIRNIWDNRKPNHTKISDTKKYMGLKENNFGRKYIKDENILNTITTGGCGSFILYDKPMYVSIDTIIKGSTFPMDFKVPSKSSFNFICGMSVPPYMMYNVANRVNEYILKKIK